MNNQNSTQQPSKTGQPVSPIESPKQPPAQKWLPLVIILVLAILIGGGILGYQYWWLPAQEPEPAPVAPEPEPEPTLDETADWKIYQNEQLGFEFLYPAVYDAEKACRPGARRNQVWIGERITIDVLKSEDLSIQQYPDRFLDRKAAPIDRLDVDEYGWKIESKESISIGGYDAVRIEYQFGGMITYGEAVFVADAKNGRVLRFDIVAGGFYCDFPDHNVYESAVFYTILESFRFLEQSAQ